jgi:hypothetical protein
VLRIVVYHILVVKESITKVIDSILVQNLSKPKVSRDTNRVKLNAMLEIFLSFLHLAGISKLSG